jgi:Zn-dependent peptidase ImmA (M78 family)/transcriptional regulator with XRE-family HTH domain
LETIDPRALGNRLQDARRARGLTQQEAAEALNVARTTITAIEKGERRLQPEELIRFAKLYGRRVNDLVGARESAGDFAVQFRTAYSAAAPREVQTQLEEAVHEFQRMCEDYFRLERVTESPISRPKPATYQTEGMDPDEAGQDIASAERNRLGLGEGPVIKLRDILENDVGLRIFFISLPSRVAGMFNYSDDLGGCIAINAAHPDERRRWSLAHEYGHFLSNRYRPEISILASYERVPAAERLADAFARCFLMPEPGLRRRFNDVLRQSAGKVTAAEVCRLADYYAVSVEAMMLRLEELRLLPVGTWDRLRDSGFKVREAQKQLGLVPRSGIEQQLPYRYQSIAVRAYQQGELTEGELARLLRVDRLQARQTVQVVTERPNVSDKGDVERLSVDLASTLGKTGS